MQERLGEGGQVGQPERFVPDGRAQGAQFGQDLILQEVVPCDDAYGHRPKSGVGPKIPEKVESALAGHAHIQDQSVGNLSSGVLERRRRRFDGSDVVAVQPERPREDLAHGQIVINN